MRRVNMWYTRSILFKTFKHRTEVAMVRTREIIPAPLEHALLATRVMAALYALDSPRRDTPVLRGAFEDAATFLRTIMNGKRHTQERLVSEKSVEYALAYGEAIRAIEMFPDRPKVVGQVHEVLETLLTTTEALTAKRDVPRESVDQLLLFFELLRDITGQANKKPIETISVSR
jgi:hypothetical protein